MNSTREKVKKNMMASIRKGPTVEEVARRDPKFNKILRDWHHINGHVKDHQGGADPRNGPEGGLYNRLSKVFGGDRNWSGNSQFQWVSVEMPSSQGLARFKFAVVGGDANIEKVIDAVVAATTYDWWGNDYDISREDLMKVLLPFVNAGWVAFEEDYERYINDFLESGRSVHDEIGYGKFEEDVKNLSPDFIKSVNELLEFLRRTNRLDLWPFYWSHNLNPNSIDPMLFTGPDGFAEFLRTVESLRKRFFEGPGLAERKPTPEDLARAKEAGFKLEEVYDTPEALAEALAKLDEVYAKKFTHFNKFGYQNLSQDDYELAVTDPDKFDEKLKYYRPQMTDAEKAQQQAYEEALRLGSQILGGGVTISSAGAASVQDQIAKLQEAAANIQNKTQNQIQGGGNNDNNNNNS